MNCSLKSIGLGNENERELLACNIWQSEQVAQSRACQNRQNMAERGIRFMAWHGSVMAAGSLNLLIKSNRIPSEIQFRTSNNFKMHVLFSLAACLP